MGERSQLVLASGLLWGLVLVQDTRGAGEWQEPLWRVVRPQHGYNGADTQPFHDEQTEFCEAQSLQLMAAAGHISFEGLVADEPDPGEQQRLFSVLQKGTALYPEGFLQRVGLRGVAFTKDAHDERWRMSGVAFEGGRIVLDTSAPRPDETLHHELFHVIEHANRLDFSDWEALNPEGFTYKRDRWQRSPKASLCFVSAYATSNPKDDRAEVFAAMMTRQELGDDCVRSKARALALAVAALWPRVPAEIAAHLPP